MVPCAAISSHFRHSLLRSDGGCGSRRGRIGIRSSAEPSHAGKLFGPAEGRWDASCLFHPIVVQDPHSFNNNNNTNSYNWRMYYYGRDSMSWHCGISPALLSSGRIGLATSPDGFSWSPFHGPLLGGAIMDPRSSSLSAFDCVHIGCTDVFYHQGMWWMYYFGGGLDPVHLPNGKSLTGMKLRVGLCKSLDGLQGFDATRYADPVLDVGAEDEWDNSMVAWARVVPPSPTHPISHWFMTYSAMDMSTTSSPSFAIGLATSQDGIQWTKMGKILERGEPGSWDDAGVGRRHVIFFDGEFLMFYEGVNKDGRHAIGLASSKDGTTWAKSSLGSHSQPGGPIFSPRPRDQNTWDNGGVACPHVVKLHDSLRLYYVGFDVKKTSYEIGLAVCDRGNIGSFHRV